MGRHLRFFSFAVALTFSVGQARTAPPTVEQLKRKVEQKEYELREAQLALTSARVRLALAEGKNDVAARECRVLLREYEPRLKAEQDQFTRGRLCTDGPLRDAEGLVAVARAWLAEADNNRDALLTELPKVITYHEWRITLFESLLKANVISEEEANQEMKRSEVDLRSAREKLAELRKKR